jgi:hypothetical protein
MIQSLKQELADWTDFDVAGLQLGRCLGVFGPDITAVHHVKSVFCSNDEPVGGILLRLLDQLVRDGVLDYDDDEQRYRWNSSFRGSGQHDINVASSKTN